MRRCQLSCRKTAAEGGCPCLIRAVRIAERQQSPSSRILSGGYEIVVVHPAYRQTGRAISLGCTAAAVEPIVDRVGTEGVVRQNIEIGPVLKNARGEVDCVCRRWSENTLTRSDTVGWNCGFRPGWRRDVIETGCAETRVLTYSYDGLNRLSSVAETAGTTSYAYDAASHETGITNANGTTVTKPYDDAGNLTSVTNKNSTGTVLSSFSYVYDTDNRRKTCTEVNGDIVTYDCDWGCHLTSESRTGTNAYSRSYIVDGVGNRTSQTVGAQTTTFTLDSDDQLNSTSSTTGGFVNSYSYNANGEQTGRTLSGTAYTVAFDYDGRQTSITQGANVKSYTYDGLDRRLSRTSGGTTTNFLYDGNQILLEKQGSTTNATYTYGNALVRKDGETPLFDGLGSERTVTSSTQAITGTLTIDGFGNQVASTGSSTNPYMFAAASRYRNDGDAGLTHVGAREYDAQVGRFTTRDTYLNQPPYLYCDHDPVNNLDPSGHCRCGCVNQPTCECPAPADWPQKIGYEWGVDAKGGFKIIEVGGHASITVDWDKEGGWRWWNNHPAIPDPRIPPKALPPAVKK